MGLLGKKPSLLEKSFAFNHANTGNMMDAGLVFD